MQEKNTVLDKKVIPKHLLKYFKLKERKTIIHRGYISHLCDIFDEVRRVLRNDGCCFVNMGDTYGGANSRASDGGRAGYGTERDGVYQRGQSKSLCQIPERFSIMMTDELGFIKRNEIIWYKRNCMPSSASDRFTVDFEKVFFFTKSEKYWFEQQFEPHRSEPHSYNGQKIQQAAGNSRAKSDGREFYSPQGRNKRCVWDIITQPSSELHFAQFPDTLVIPMLSAGCPPNGIVLDPFAGMCTVAKVAIKQKKKFIMIDLSSIYVKKSRQRIKREIEHQKFEIFKELT